MKSIVYNADCLEAMRQMPDKAFDLAVVDPPYGIGFDGYTTNTLSNEKWRNKTPKVYAKKEWDSKPPSPEYFTELMRVACHQIIWGANHFISLIPFDSSCWLLWDKRNDGKVQADCEMAWSSFSTTVRMFRFLWDGMRQENIAGKEDRIHPTQKPVALYKWLLTNYAKPGDTILDTHLGSGSSRIAAYDLGFDFVGYELDKDYFEAQERRFADHIAQPKLFIPEPQAIEQGTLIEG